MQTTAVERNIYSTWKNAGNLHHPNIANSSIASFDKSNMIGRFINLQSRGVSANRDCLIHRMIPLFHQILLPR